MSGGVKSGLIFGGLQVLLVAVFTVIGFLPAMLGPSASILGVAGALCCGPLGSILVGALAGYIGVRWNREPAGVGQGALAGAIAGIGAVVGSLLVWGGLLAIVNMVAQSDPEALAQTMRDVLAQQPDTGLTEDDMQGLMTFSVLLVGLCSGLVALLFTLGAGALGGWFAVRQRGEALPPIQMPPPAS